MIQDSESNGNGYPEEWESIISQIEIHLATGNPPRHRLEGIAGLMSSEFSGLLERAPLPFRERDRARLEKAIPALADWIAEQDASNATAVNGFAVTPTFQAFTAYIEDAHRDNLLGAITGGVGIGKSEAAKAFAAAHPRTMLRPGAVRVEFTDADSNQTAALSKILTALVGPHGGAYRSWQLEEEIGKALRPNDILLLDECNELGAAVNIIKSLRNRFDIPIVAIGNPDFTRNVYGKKSTFSALASRMLPRDIPKTTEADVAAWFAWADLSGADIYRMACAIACRAGEGGGLRSLALLIDRCRRKFPGRAITAGMLRDVAASFGRGIQIKRVA
jgi:hypothetical protein